MPMVVHSFSLKSKKYSIFKKAHISKFSWTPSLPLVNSFTFHYQELYILKSSQKKGHFFLNFRLSFFWIQNNRFLGHFITIFRHIDYRKKARYPKFSLSQFSQINWEQVGMLAKPKTWNINTLLTSIKCNVYILY